MAACKLCKGKTKLLGGCKTCGLDEKLTTAHKDHFELTVATAPGEVTNYRFKRKGNESFDAFLKRNKEKLVYKFTMARSAVQSKTEENVWYKKWWVIVIALFFFAGMFGGDSNDDATMPTPTPKISTVEMNVSQIFDDFAGLTKLQREEKLNELQTNRIQTNIRVNKVWENTFLSTNYGVEHSYNPPFEDYSYVRVFFPPEDKDKLLTADIGDRIVFQGELYSYTPTKYILDKRIDLSKIEFTNARLVEVIKKE